ncbi:transglutaminase domain-containing protein [Tannockella kyphosi]|uniref:transglutaminase domain-containing protein n=1 Tax=Tannockella kyphosi TaxID=2899121 RepID=UPI0020122CC9|nr:transglutaminase domain-containing protein [Tannockella kyphosi]
MVNIKQFLLDNFIEKSKLKKNILLFIVISIGCFCTAFYYLGYDTVCITRTVELGDEVTASFFEKRGFGEISFVDEIETYEASNVGEFEIMIKKGFFTHICTLVVEDTIAPSASSVDIVISFLDSVTIEELFDDLDDVATVTYSFINEIDYSSYEKQEINISLIDESGNETIVTSFITITADTTAPIIDAPEKISVYVGGSISYLSQITITDDSDYELDIDNSKVNLNSVGTYEVLVTATDVLGNSSTQTINVIVEEEEIASSIEESDYEVIQNLADELLSELIDDSMSLTEKASAIYYWCRNSIKYTGSSDKTDWIKEAYDGLVYQSGDCFTYASTAKILLTQAGIPNLDIERTPTETTTYYSHYWNLVDVGNGWVHFDSTYRSDGTIIFLWDTETLLEYSDSHNYCHNFTASDYPTIN